MTVGNWQSRVRQWTIACFGKEITFDKTERNHRFLEEALELVQSLNCSKSEAHQIVDYVYNRPIGESKQELGGVMVTIAALANANGLDMVKSANRELMRVWAAENFDKIRAKQLAKPKLSPLPE